MENIADLLWQILIFSANTRIVADRFILRFLADMGVWVMGFKISGKQGIVADRF